LAKLPDLGLLFFYRVVIPGAVIVLVTGPLLLRLFPLLGITDATAQVTASAVLAAAIGFVLSALDDPIYEFYEGRHGWPDGIRKWATKRLAHKVARLYRAAEAAKDTEYNEIWAELRHYPLDAEAKPFVARPTEMGNILAAYEDYSYRTYGMDADFYWPRLWLVLDDKARKEIDESWAPTDMLLYLSFGLVSLALIYLGLLVLSFVPGLAVRDAMIEPDRLMLATSALGFLLGSYLTYRASLPGHIRNGDYFMSVFDLYRTELAKRMEEPTAAAAKHWDGLREKLLYKRMRE